MRILFAEAPTTSPTFSRVNKDSRQVALFMPTSHYAFRLLGLMSSGTAAKLLVCKLLVCKNPVLPGFLV